MEKKRNCLSIIIAVILGFVVAMVIMAIAIYFGYTNVYTSNVENTNVSLFGINIYSLVKNGNKYNGVSIGQNMGIICTIFIVLAVCIERVIIRVKFKK